MGPFRRLARKTAAALAGLVAAATPAFADCGGQDLMAELARTDPAAHAAILERGRSVPNGEGRLWKVERAGARPSWLFGTLHSTEAAERWLPRKAVLALGEARLVMVELAPDEQARLTRRLAEDPQFGLASEGPRLSERLDPALRAEAERVLAERGMSMAAADRLKPWLVISAIAVPLCEQAALAGGKRLLDDAIAREAKAWGVPVVSLETYEQTFAAFDALTEAEMTELLADGFASAARDEDLRRTLETLYADERIAAIMEFNIWFSARSSSESHARRGAEAVSRVLIEARNAQWMEHLVPALEKGGVFAAFGALHLPGETGIVEMLRDRGFTVTRVPG